MLWATGDADYMEKNMPVVTGFRDGKELPSIVVVENLFAGIAEDAMPVGEIDSTIEVWMRKCPTASHE